MSHPTKFCTKTINGSKKCVYYSFLPFQLTWWIVRRTVVRSHYLQNDFAHSGPKRNVPFRRSCLKMSRTFSRSTSRSKTTSQVSQRLSLHRLHLWSVQHNRYLSVLRCSTHFSDIFIRVSAYIQIQSEVTFRPFNSWKNSTFLICGKKYVDTWKSRGLIAMLQSHFFGWS